jgi:DNA polymerase-3 subunit epsilon
VRRCLHIDPEVTVGLLDRFRRPVSPVPALAAPPLVQDAVGGGFAVVDVETTGLSHKHHRIVELAILRTDAHGRVVDEWACRFHPEAPVGATHIHGITDADVAHAPRFADVRPQIAQRLAGLAVVGHNLPFDLTFLRTEFARAGWALPDVPTLCTLDASRAYLPHLERRRLSDCCAASGIAQTGQHSALGDARATAILLRSYLDPYFGPSPLPEHVHLPRQAASVQWPTAPGGVDAPPPLLPDRVLRKMTQPRHAAAPLVGMLSRLRLADCLDDGATEGSLAYLELLASALDDGVLDDAERAALSDLAGAYGLGDTDRHAAHRSLVLALARLALEDGKVSRPERAELTAVSSMLDVPAKVVADLLDRAEQARHALLAAGLKDLPDGWLHGEPLRVGARVVFTGEHPQREALEQRAESLGVRIMSDVNTRTAILVTDGAFQGGKAADARALGIRTVSPAEFATLLAHLQPAVRREPVLAVPAQRTAAPPAGAVVSAAPAADAPPPASVAPGVVRQWAAANGFVVGVRGRLPAEVLQAYAAAHSAASAPDPR